jgi:hypothetical protein
MSVERLAFCIGPLPGDGVDTYGVFVTPARPDADAFFGHSPGEALREVVEAYGGDRLVVPPELGKDAQPLGLAIATPNDQQRGAMLRTAYEVALGEELDDVEDADLIPRFARAGARFAIATPWAEAHPLRYAVVSFEGDIDPKEWEVVIAGPPEGEPGFTAYPGRGSIVRMVASVDRGGVPASDQFPSVGVMLDPAPPYLVQTLRSLLGIGIFPRPIALENGEMKVLGDGELAVISALAESIAALAEKGKPETISVRATGTEFRATARQFNPAG